MNAIKEFLQDAWAVSRIKPKEVAFFVLVGFVIAAMVGLLA